MNIGRGYNCNEQDLVEALKDETIAGAVLDVFEEEPLSKDSELWQLKNVLITPHSSDNESNHAWFDRALAIFKENLSRFKKNEQLVNLCDKQAGY